MANNDYTNLHELTGEIIDLSFVQTTPIETTYANLLYSANTVYLAAEAGDLTDQMLSSLRLYYEKFIKEARVMGVDEVLS